MVLVPPEDSARMRITIFLSIELYLCTYVASLCILLFLSLRLKPIQPSVPTALRSDGFPNPD
jgi:hypothetical protein